MRKSDTHADTLFFATPAEMRRWLKRNHALERELWIGFFKVGSGKQSISWPESVDEALCFGWIDGRRKSIDSASYKIRFTPRKTSSIWSAVNIKRAAALIKTGKMEPAGMKAYEARRENRTGVYSHEQRSATLVEPYASKLKENTKAWVFFNAQAPSYQKAANWWVVSAKREDTRVRRLAQLIADSEAGRRIAQFISPVGKK